MDPRRVGLYDSEQSLRAGASPAPASTHGFPQVRFCWRG